MAESAIRAGFRPLCVDFFEDSDLTTLLENGRGRFCGRISEFQQLPQLIRNVRPSIPLVWAGGLENHCDTLRKIAQQRRVLGADLEAVQNVRNLKTLNSLLSCQDLQMPRVLLEPCGTLAGTWLKKPLGSSGGLGIHRIGKEGNFDGGADYLQEYIDGVPISATFVCDSIQMEMVGISLQLVGWKSLGASEFAYCGSMGPVPLPSPLVEMLWRAGRSLQQAGMRGAFGVDFLLSCGQLWFLEVNPRLTASHLIFDQTFPTRETLFSKHLSALGYRAGEQHRRANRQSNPRASVFARLILWATQTIEFQQIFPSSRFTISRAESRWSDLPIEGTNIEPGNPICSLEVSANSISQLRERLERELGAASAAVPTDGKAVASEFAELLGRFEQNLNNAAEQAGC